MSLGLAGEIVIHIQSTTNPPHTIKLQGIGDLNHNPAASLPTNIVLDDTYSWVPTIYFSHNGSWRGLTMGDECGIHGYPAFFKTYAEMIQSTTSIYSYAKAVDVGFIWAGIYNATLSYELIGFVPPAVADALNSAGIDPLETPEEVLESLISANKKGALEVIPPATTQDQNVELGPNAVVVLGVGSFFNGNMEGVATSSVIIGEDATINGNVSGMGLSFVGGDNIEINGNVSGNRNELLVGLEAEVHINGNVEVAALKVAQEGEFYIDGNVEVAVLKVAQKGEFYIEGNLTVVERLELAANSSLDVNGNLICDSGTSADVSQQDVAIKIGGNNECATLPYGTV